MGNPLHLLMVAESEDDAALVLQELQGAGLDPKCARVNSLEAMAAALDRQSWDIVIADNSLPHLGMPAALALLKNRGLDLPFIIVSGTSGEDLAVAAMKAGAHDYLMKGHLARLVPAVNRELHEAEERQARREGAEKIREQAALLDNAQDAILVQDLEGRILYWNNSAERLYGWTAEEANGRYADELLFKDSPGANETGRAVVQTGQWQGELHHVSKDDREVVVSSIWTLVRDVAGQSKSILVVNTDRTEKKQLEARLVRAQRLESIGSLAGGIAHDLNNILTPILMGSQLLRLRLADVLDQKILSTIESNAQRGAEIVKQILSFARGVEGKHTVLDVKHLIGEIEHIAHETFPRSITMQTKVGKGLWAIRGDATQVYQVLLNLCVNARDAMPQGGTLKIEAANVLVDETMLPRGVEARPGPHVVITVSDSGTGMAPEVQAKLFGPFATAEKTGTGTGLGLSTALQIVTGHGGFMDVFSETGKGARFKVYLPAMEVAAEAESVGEQPELPLGHEELVLVIDDEAAMREMMKAALEAHGYRVITATNGKQALTLCGRHIADIDIVVTDVIMPQMDGPATIQAMHKLDPHLKFIAISGLTNSSRVTEVADVGSVTSLSKPFSTRQLLNALQEVLGEKYRAGGQSKFPPLEGGS